MGAVDPAVQAALDRLKAASQNPANYFIFGDPNDPSNPWVQIFKGGFDMSSGINPIIASIVNNTLNLPGGAYVLGTYNSLTNFLNAHGF